MKWIKVLAVVLIVVIAALLLTRCGSRQNSLPADPEQSPVTEADLTETEEPEAEQTTTPSPKPSATPTVTSANTATDTSCLHESLAYRIVREATCTESGLASYVCETCGATVYSAKLPEKGHIYRDQSDEDAHWSLCTVCGATTAREPHSFNASKICSVCGLSCTHAYEQTIVEPSCTENGYTIYTCTKCAHSYRDAVTPPLGHDYVSTLAEEATCTKTGREEHVCSRCQDTQVQIVPTTEHQPVTDPAVEPTCQYAGKTEGSHCSVCGAIITRQEPVASVDHRYNNGFCVWCGARDPAYHVEIAPGSSGGDYELPLIPG